jgi:hypothetical protein
MKFAQTKAAKLLGAFAIAAATLAAPAAKADVVLSFSNSQWFGDIDPGMDPTVFATATFANAGANTVTLTLDYFGIIPGDDGNAKISRWYFNTSNYANLASVAWTSGDPAGTGSGADISKAQNAFKADGTGGYYDLLINFHDGGALTEQARGTSVVFTLMGTGIDEDDFNALSSGGSPSHVSAIHVQSFGPNGNSLWIGGSCIDERTCEDPDDPVGDPVPEPGTLALLGLGLGAMAYRRRRH